MHGMHMHYCCYLECFPAAKPLCFHPTSEEKKSSSKMRQKKANNIYEPIFNHRPHSHTHIICIFIILVNLLLWLTVRLSIPGLNQIERKRIKHWNFHNVNALHIVNLIVHRNWSKWCTTERNLYNGEEERWRQWSVGTEYIRKKWNLLDNDLRRQTHARDCCNLRSINALAKMLTRKLNHHQCIVYNIRFLS